jgi:hypothetical protein
MLPAVPCRNTSIPGIKGIGSGLIPTRNAPDRFAITGRDAARYTTEDVKVKQAASFLNRRYEYHVPGSP